MNSKSFTSYHVFKGSILITCKWRGKCHFEVEVQLHGPFSFFHGPLEDCTVEEFSQPLSLWTYWMVICYFYILIFQLRIQKNQRERVWHARLKKVEVAFSILKFHEAYQKNGPDQFLRLLLQVFVIIKICIKYNFFKHLITIN